MAGLEPDAIGIRHPATLVRDVDIGDEMLALSLVRLEAIGKAVESGNGNMSLRTSQRLPMIVTDAIGGNVREWPLSREPSIGRSWPVRVICRAELDVRLRGEADVRLRRDRQRSISDTRARWRRGRPPKSAPYKA